MKNNTKLPKVVLAITGASGSVYGKLLFSKLQLLQQKKRIAELGIIFSDAAREVWKYELDEAPEDTFKSYPIYPNSDLFAPFASGSSGYDTMIICPCSMGTLGKIAHGISIDLISRSADVMLKERKKLILVSREMPLSLIHIKNIKEVTEAGGIICPASPSFYSKPLKIVDLEMTVIDRILNLADLPSDSFRWDER